MLALKRDRLGHGPYPEVSLFEAANSITSALANEFAEADAGLHTSALMELGLILFVITFFVLVASKLLLAKLSSNGR